MTPVPEWQRSVHIAAEALAIALIVPLLLLAAKDARPPHKKRLRAIALGTLVVDGLLLWSWLTRR